VTPKGTTPTADPGGRRKISRGFWHTEVRNGRHTRAYTRAVAGVTTLSQMLEIRNERHLENHTFIPSNGVSRNRDTVVV
jgi:hypothetical protein